MATELEVLQNIEYLLEVIISKDGSYKDKLNKDNKSTLKEKIYKEVVN